MSKSSAYFKKKGRPATAPSRDMSASRQTEQLTIEQCMCEFSQHSRDL